MPVLLLGPNTDTLASIIEDDVVVCADELCSLTTVEALRPSFAVSYGYRHIVPSAVIAALGQRIINLHISYLPWNRGSDPNLWSWLSNTPKGISIHWLTEGLDKGGIIAQELVEFDTNHTLRTSYLELQTRVTHLFARVWPDLISGATPGSPQSGHGSYHRSSDKDRHMDALPLGWDTPCAAVAEYGRRHKLWLGQSG